jgi:hypothetical protein
MGKKAETKRQWMRRVMDSSKIVEKLQPKFADYEEYPKWVNNLWLMLMPVSHPGLHLKANQKLGVRQFGAFWGRQYALAAVQRGKVQLSAKTLEEMNRAIAGLKPSKPEIAQFVESSFKRHKVWYPAFTKFIKETLGSACDRPYAEAVGFFQAFGNSMMIKPTDLETERTMGVSEKIAWVMILEWLAISKLRSVGQLHSMFEAALKPHGIVINLKRMEKLCQRIGLRFRGRGRPKKPKIQTNSAGRM